MGQCKTVDVAVYTMQIDERIGSAMPVASIVHVTGLPRALLAEAEAVNRISALKPNVPAKRLAVVEPTEAAVRAALQLRVDERAATQRRARAAKDVDSE